MTAKKAPEDHKRSGQPTKYRAQFCKQAKQLAKLGATDYELAQFFDVACSTLSLWMVTHPKFSEAIKLGRAPADRRTERSLFHRANGYSFESEEIFLIEEIEERPGPKPGDEPSRIITKKALRVPIVKHVPPDTTACIFWLKNRKPKDWRDRKDVTLENAPGQVFKTEIAADPEPIGKYYERLAKIAADRAARGSSESVGRAAVSESPRGEETRES